MSRTETLTETLIRYKRGIEAALRHGEHSHSFDDIVRGVLTGQLHFYPLTDTSFAIMERQEYPNLSVYHCFLAGGDLADLVAAQGMISDNGGKLGCTKLTMMGRRGFARALPAHGWRETHVRMELPLT